MTPKGAMSAEIQTPIWPVVNRTRTLEWVLLLLLALGVPWGIWSVFVLMRGGDTQLVEFTALVGCFILLAIGYLGLHGLRGLSWFSVPVFVTFYTLTTYIALPDLRFATGDDRVDPLYVHAMLLVLIGLTAFWIGSLAVMKEIRLRFVPGSQKTSIRVAIMSTIALVLGAGAKTVMWKVGLFSYLADRDLSLSSLWYIQWLTYISSLLNAALIVSAIEVLGKRSAGPFIKIVFWLSVVFSIGFGVISGMKGEILFPLLYLVLIYGITNKRIPRIAFLLPLLPVLIYPFGNAYRANLAHGYRAQVNTIDGLEALLEKSFNDVVFSKGEVNGEGFSETTSRLSDLTYVRDMLRVPDPSLLNGDEKIWLAPIYPLIPRAIWPSKPIFNMNQRLSIALGRPETTASAAPVTGYLYLMYGTFGVIVGLFFYGICYQIYMNWFSKDALMERRLFIYVLMLIQLMGLGGDVVGAIGVWIQTGLVFVFMSYFIYGRSDSSSRRDAQVIHGFSTPVASQLTS
jgi:hypothetical protein